MSYNSKYKGSEVDAALDLAKTALQSIPFEYITENELNNKGFVTTQVLNTELSSKVDKDGSKQLSTEDFTTALKTKLNSLTNYDDTAIQSAVNNLQTQLNTLVSGDANTAIESFNEIIAFLDGVTDSQTLDGIVAAIERQIAGKQDIISDLSTIRSGASKGATALQSFTETDPVFSASPAASIKSTDISNWNGKTSNTGTVTGVKINGSTKSPSSGTVDIGNVVTSVKVNGTSYSPSSGIVDLGTISGGGGSSSSSTEEWVTLGSSTTTHTLEPQKIYVLECLNSRYTFNFSGNASGAQYRIFIYTASWSPTVSFPTHKCANGNELSFEQYKIYEISFLVTPFTSDPLCTWTSYDYMKNIVGGDND